MIALIATLVVILASASLMWQRRWDVRGKNVFVTGGSQGLGLAFAKLLAAKGAHVVICSRTASKLAAAAKEIEAVRASPTQRVSFVSADVSSFEGAKAALAQCTQPDMVVCCAGGAKPGFFLEHTEADFEGALKTDYWTALSTAHVCRR